MLWFRSVLLYGATSSFVLASSTSTKTSTAAGYKVATTTTTTTTKTTSSPSPTSTSCGCNYEDALGEKFVNTAAFSGRDRLLNRYNNIYNYDDCQAYCDAETQCTVWFLDVERSLCILYHAISPAIGGYNEGVVGQRAPDGKCQNPKCNYSSPPATTKPVTTTTKAASYSTFTTKATATASPTPCGCPFDRETAYDIDRSAFQPGDHVIATYSNTTDLTKCQNACDNDPTCTIWTVNKQDKICTIFSVNFYIYVYNTAFESGVKEFGNCKRAACNVYITCQCSYEYDYAQSLNKTTFVKGQDRMLNVFKNELNEEYCQTHCEYDPLCTVWSTNYKKKTCTTYSVKQPVFVADENVDSAARVPGYCHRSDCKD